MATITTDPLIRYYCPESSSFHHRTRLRRPCSLRCSKVDFISKLHLNATCGCASSSARTGFCNAKSWRFLPIRSSTTGTAPVETFESEGVVFKEDFPVKRTETVEGKVFIRLGLAKEQNWQLTVGCSLPGKWIIHWGVSYVGDMGRLSVLGHEWDQPPEDMIPSGSVLIKDYAIETPLMKNSEGDVFHEVKIDLNLKSSIAALIFVLKDEETGAWYQHRGRDFRVPLIDYPQKDDNLIGKKKGFNIWPGTLGPLSSVILKSEESYSKDQENVGRSSEPRQDRRLEKFYEEFPVTKEFAKDNSVSITVKRSLETAKHLVRLETDIPGNVIVHWGVCRDDTKTWRIPAGPYPQGTSLFKNKALRTLLQPKEDGNGSWALFTLDEEHVGFVFVLKLNESTWLNCMGNDFYVPLSSSSSFSVQSEPKQVSRNAAGRGDYTKEIINDIRNLVSDISSQTIQKTQIKEAQESILQEIEKLAAEAYSIFRSAPTFSEEIVTEIETQQPPVKISSGTGTGFEILCQGFNWESNKSGRWYMEMKEKVEEIASLGFTVVWLPPPTESVSPEGYMPRDLYNLNSRYGTIDELKDLVKKFHEVGVKVLGDVVLNHRCAHYQNQNGIWNLFGGPLNWDDRAIVGDDPHFQGRGNKSSGDNFHAAPNIDHSQDFVRKDIKEWLCWLMEEVGYDGWRLDFVRGFWGGYVKDYLDASKPSFAVGEYWDSLNYIYGNMDYNQDAHRQRIINWINATGGTAGAFDVTTKGILHSALEKCEYWRLSDAKGKPPGVVGWWPSRAVTFIENHDTGSTQGHWRFPSGKEMQGYAYILTHPGTPAVFFDHLFSHYQSEIAALLSLRHRNKLHCRSTVKIAKAERDVYAAIIDEKVAMKIGPGHYEPPSGPQSWHSATEGRDYKVWEAAS